MLKNKKNIGLAIVSLLLSFNVSHADDGWVSGVSVEYTKANSTWVSAYDISGTSIMSKLKSSFTYKSRMDKIKSLTIRQNYIRTYINGTVKDYGNMTSVIAPNGTMGFTRWYDSPYGLLLDYLTPFSSGSTMTAPTTDINPVDISDSVNQYNKIHFPNGAKTVYLAANSNELGDAKLASATMANTGQIYPLVLGNLSGMSYTDSAFTYINQLKAKNIIMLGGTGIVEATSGLSSNYNVIRVGGLNRTETESYLLNLPNKTQTPGSYAADANGVVMEGMYNADIYSHLIKLAQTKNISYLKSAVNVALNYYGSIGSSPSKGQNPAVVLGVHNGDFETYWICYFYEKDYGRAVYQYVLPNYFPKIVLSKNISAWTNQNIEVTASISVGPNMSIASQKWAAGDMATSYFAGAGTDLPANNKFTVSANGTYTVYVKDSYGNETVSKINITNIDKINSTAGAYVDNISHSGFDVVVYNIADNLSGVNRVEICAYRDGWDIDGKWTTYYVSSGSAGFRINTSDFGGKAGAYHVDVRVYDNAGNGGSPIAYLSANVPYPNVFSSPIVISNHEYSNGTVYWVQSGNPFTAKCYGYTNPENSRYKITSQFILARAENATTFNSNFKSFLSKIPASYGSYSKAYDFGLYYNTYSTSLNLASGSFANRTEGSWVDSYFNFTLTGDETVKLSPLMRVEAEGTYFDSVWDTSTVIVKSDSGAPSINLSASPGKPWSNSNTTVYISVNDSRSGVKNWTVKRKVNNGAWTSLSDKTTSVALTTDGIHTIAVTAVDNVGNTSTIDISVNVDKTAPYIILMPSTNNWTNQNITVAVDVSDNLSGISVKKWAEGNRNVSYFATAGNTLGNSFVATQNNTYTVYAKDNAGNETVKTITIGKIDKTNPIISGNFDNLWVKGSKTLSFTSTDNLSGISSIKLWNEAKSSVIKTGTVNNNVGSLTHTVTTEGITKYKIETIDNALNTSISNVVVRIDNTAPTCSLTMPSITNTRDVITSVSNIIDTMSGVKEVWASESSDFSSGVTKVSLANLTNKEFNFNLSTKNTIDNHFTTRTVYLRLYDNVGNYSSYSRSVKLIPVAPSIPVITLPKEDTVYVKGEPIILKWDYNSTDKDVGRLPQLKAEITLIHKGGNKDGTDISYSYIIEEDIFDLQFRDLEFGDYEVKVKVFNFLNPDVFSESEVTKFRYNKFKTDGNVFTKDITLSSPMKYIVVSTIYDLPEKSSIEGFIYYEKTTSGEFDLTKRIPFKIKRGFSISDIEILPKKVNSIKIEYKLKRSPLDIFNSPILDDITVYAR